jgi:hypothetical protein
LPAQVLLKLKPARDLFYLRRSIPDFAQFRIAYQLIKEWAKARGVYASKFGYLGGIHLSVLLVRVCKMIVHEGLVASAADVIATFFNHYAKFDWKTQMVFDPFFHQKLRYNRTPREPLCLLGWHVPTLNTALAASVPTVMAITREFISADALLSRPGLTWESFFSSISPGGQNLTPGAAEFLTSFKSYIRLSIQYWGPSLEKVSTLVGWLESRCVMVLVGE